MVPKLQLATSSAMGGKFHKLATLRSKVISVKLWNILPKHVIGVELVNSFK